MLYLGIDTGGSFTDGVLLDPQNNRIVKTAKVLTTHHDLRLCIANILAEILPSESQQIAMVALSTTLATNAIAEGKRQPTALFLLGYDADLVHKFQFQEEFATRDYFFIQGKHNLEGVEIDALDEVNLAAQVSQISDQVKAFAVSSYAGVMNNEHEIRAAQIIAGLSEKPVVQGHHLTSRLNSIHRATTASLNASLITTAVGFLQAVKEILAERQITCPLVMVKGDGSLAKAEYAVSRPVEIIHSGPATSAIGGRYLAGVDDALVIDVGGTTTDLALVQGGRMDLLKGEASVGGYHTCVTTINSRSFGLGGDSYIRFDRGGEITVGPDRVIPLSYLAHVYPEVKKRLLAWLSGNPMINYADRLEHWMLIQPPERPMDDIRTQRALELLANGPQRLPELLKFAGAKSSVQVDADLLVRHNVIQRAGLTPTDLLHVTGEYAPWDAETARLVVEKVARSRGVSVDGFIRQAREWISRRITAEVVSFLSGKDFKPRTQVFSDGDMGNWLFEQALNGHHSPLGVKLHLKVPLVGIGAPAKAFLLPVAEALGTNILFPEHYEVANAVGTVVGNIMVQQDGEVYPCVEGQVQTGYYARAGGQQMKFAHLDEAIAQTRAILEKNALDQALAAGAGEMNLDWEERQAAPGFVILSARVVGKPALN